MEQCSFPRCGQLSNHTYMGRGVCVTHWIKLCDADSSKENKLLRRIGLVRNKHGEVMLLDNN
jgi:hypothetical protein